MTKKLSFIMEQKSEGNPIPGRTTPIKRTTGMSALDEIRMLDDSPSPNPPQQQVYYTPPRSKASPSKGFEAKNLDAVDLFSTPASLKAPKTKVVGAKKLQAVEPFSSARKVGDIGAKEPKATRLSSFTKVTKAEGVGAEKVETIRRSSTAHKVGDAGAQANQAY
jgi:hypothetical protein